MRRRGMLLLAVVIVAGALYGTWTVAYRAGESDGRTKITADRSAFTTRIASGPQTGSGQASGAGGSPGAAGGGAAGTRGPGGSAVAGAGGPAGSSGAGAPAALGTASAGRGSGAASNLVGKVTKVDGTTLSVTQSDNATVSVTTNADTAIRKLVAGALTDLKAGDLVMVDGSKTSDTAYSAKSVTGLGAAPGGGGGGGAGRAPGGGAPAGAPATALIGQIKSLDGATMMVQGLDGATITVTTTPTTVVRTQQPGTLSDIKSGDTLLIQGDKTSDTAFLARTITNQGASS